MVCGEVMLSAPLGQVHGSQQIDGSAVHVTTVATSTPLAFLDLSFSKPALRCSVHDGRQFMFRHEAF